VAVLKKQQKKEKRRGPFVVKGFSLSSFFA
jgi:hypothetical protein